MIPMVDLHGQYRLLRTEIDQAITGVLESSQFILGPNSCEFEIEAAHYLQVPHAIGCASGTDALHLALRALDIGPGDEVITPSFTFVATAEAIRYVGADPVFVDVQPNSFNLDPEDIVGLISPRTRAIIAVHLYGQAAALSPILELTQRHGIALIEDCAQAFGACLEDGRCVGSAGTIGCFSFFPSKNLACYGDGGMLTCQDEKLAKRLKILRNHGSQRRYYHDIVGYNSRLDELQAAILRVKLKHIDTFNAQRKAAAQRYDALLQEFDVQLPQRCADHVFHQYTILTSAREVLQAKLNEQQIASAIYYPLPLHQQHAFQQWGTRSLPVTETLAQRCLSLPMFPELSAAQQQQVATAIAAGLRSS